jgi:S-adenosylmethionine decarboxylase
MANPPPPPPPATGVEWVVDAFGCDPDRLRDPGCLRRLCELILNQLDLRPVGPPVWHAFPGPGGVTGLYLLAESHLAVHTFPEHGLATLNLFCCRPRPQWPWAERLRGALAAERVTVRPVTRGTTGGTP